MGPLAIVGLAEQLCSFVAETYKILDACKASNDVFNELQQEVGTLQHVLLDMTAILDPPDSAIYGHMRGEKLCGDENPWTSSLCPILDNLTSVVYKLKLSLPRTIDLEDTTIEGERIQEWTAKMQRLRMQLIVLLLNNHPQAEFSSEHDLFKDYLEEPQRRRSSDGGLDRHTFQRTTVWKHGTPKLEGLRRGEVIKVTVPTYDYLSGPYRPGMLRVNGLGGMGKTQLARKVITPPKHEIPMGVWLLRGSGPVHGILSSLASVVTSGTAAIYMRDYDQLHSHQRHGKLHQLIPSHVFFQKPSPDVFVIATITHGLATLLYYMSRKTDRYREWFLGIGVLVAAGVGFVVKVDTQGVLLSIMPLMLTGSLVLCTVCNILWNCCRGNQKGKTAIAEREWDEKSGPRDDVS